MTLKNQSNAVCLCPLDGVIETIGKLKENYRIALTLSLIEGFDNEEVSSIMKISNENCRTTISRAKNKLRTLLAESTMVN